MDIPYNILYQDDEGSPQPNRYYQFKRELKALQRRPTEVLKHFAKMAEDLIDKELDFVEAQARCRTRMETFLKQREFKNTALDALAAVREGLASHTHHAHAAHLFQVTQGAEKSIRQWLLATKDEIVQEKEKGYAAP